MSDQTLNIHHFAREPFRAFFPLAVLAGILGVALWPLHLWEITPLYPGQAHARLMAFGFFGGFIFGFLGTAMPRMLSAKPLRAWELLPLVAIYLIMVVAFVFGKMALGDLAFLILSACFIAVMAPRAKSRKDMPPPGFILVGLAFLCVLAGAAMGFFQAVRETESLFAINLQKLLCYQGFILLPILGIGPFILPRFFGLPSPHDLPEMVTPGKVWLKKAGLAFAVGLVVVATFVMEAAGRDQAAYAIRFLAVAGYALVAFPLHKAPKARSGMGLAIRLAFLSLEGGFLAIALVPGYRVGLLHLTLVGGFAVITFIVATRVVFGHSGNIDKLKGRNLWILLPVGLMLLGMATRISGDFFPHIMATHYIYGALLWIGSVLLWAVAVLPKVLQVDKSE